VGSALPRDAGDPVPHSQRTWRDQGRDVAAALRGAGDVAGVLAEDAGAVRPVARAKRSAKSAAVPASGDP